MKAFAGLPKRQFRDADAQAAAEAFWELPAGTLNGYVVEPLVGALERPGNPDITEVLIHDGQDRAFGLTLISPRKVAT